MSCRRSRPLLAPGRTWFRLIDLVLGIAEDLKKARARGRGH